MQSDDLSKLFKPNPKGPALPAMFRQAELLAFDADDGSNTVLIGTTEVEDLSLLVTGAQIGLEAGDNIIVMYLGNSAMIVGKIASVGGPNYGASNDGHAGFLSNNTSSPSASNAGVTVATGTIVAPGWANSASLTMLGDATLHNGSGALDNLWSVARCTRTGFADAFSGSAANAVPSTFFGSTYALFSSVIDVVPGSTMSFTYKIFAGTTWPADVNGFATLSVSAQFFREAA